MSAIDTAALLGKRQSGCPNGQYQSRGYCYTGWEWYGRWIFAAVIIVVLLAIVFLWACINSRRRRRNGRPPMYGMGWVGGPQGQYNNNPQGYNNAPPPAYGQPQGSYPMPQQNQPTGNTFRSNDGYYGQHEGIYQPKDNGPNDYAPPTGPPPAKVH